MTKHISNNNNSLSIKDIQNISFIKAEYYNSYHTAEYEFEADIEGKRQSIYYFVNKHDNDEESFSIHTDPSSINDLYNRLSVKELNELDFILSNEVRIAHYERKIAEAKDIDSLKEVEYEFMEDFNFPKILNERFWESYYKKEQNFVYLYEEERINEKSNKFLNGYTIKSQSEEGVYYYVKDWRNNKAIWVSEDKLKQEYLFTSLGKAENSLLKLLEVMDEYRTDTFIGIEIKDSVIKEVELSKEFRTSLIINEKMDIDEYVDESMFIFESKLEVIEDIDEKVSFTKQEIEEVKEHIKNLDDNEDIEYESAFLDALNSFLEDITPYKEQYKDYTIEKTKRTFYPVDDDYGEPNTDELYEKTEYLVYKEEDGEKYYFEVKTFFDSIDEAKEHIDSFLEKNQEKSIAEAPKKQAATKTIK